jgi:multidrug resistance efflux pump
MDNQARVRVYAVLIVSQVAGRIIELSAADDQQVQY